MTRIARLTFATIFATLIAGPFFVSGAAHASSLYTVTVAPAEDTVPIGNMAIFRVKVQGQTAALPSFDYDVEGGTLAAVASIDPTAANVAEGAVFVTRESEGTARLKVRLGSEVLATGEARFARMGKLNLNVTLDAGPDAAARTWRYEIVSSSGHVLASLTANTSGDAPSDSVSSALLPFGFYTVRQVLGSDTRTSCAAGAFYQVSAPVGGETTLQMADDEATVNFIIAPCPDLPSDLSVLIPVDTIASAPGVEGDAGIFPGETPVSEVRGARDEGPGNPLPPRVGNTALVGEQTSNLYQLFLAAGALATLAPLAAWPATALVGRSRR